MRSVANLLTHLSCSGLYWCPTCDQPVKLASSSEKVQKPFPKPPQESLDVKEDWMHVVRSKEPGFEAI